MYELVLFYNVERSFFSKLFFKNNKFYLNLKSFNTPELARDFLMEFSKCNEAYIEAKLHNIKTNEWFNFNKHGFI
jgi:hypothetical protein